MLTKAIKYTNFNGQEVTKNFYFNITKAEIALRELESDGTWSETLKNIQKSDKGSVVMPEFRKIIKWTYGQKSDDGESFEKSDAIWERFNNSEPWSVLIMELLTDAGYAAEFINACMPADIAAANRERQAQDGFRPGSNTAPPAMKTLADAGYLNTSVPRGTVETPADPGYGYLNESVTRTSTPREPQI